METAKRNIHIIYRRHVQPLLRKMSLTVSAEKFTFPESDLAIPKGSLILVTGATGYIATHIINEALRLGFRVRGTVRDEGKGETIKRILNNENFETVIVKDLTDEHGFDKAVDGCDGVIHAASVVSFSADPHEVVPVTVAGAINIMKSAVKAGTVKRLVYTSSSTAACMPVPDTVFTVGKDTWNQETVDLVNALKPPYKQENAFHIYGASKTEAERAVWKFVKDEKPNFVVNSVLPDTNLGKVLNVAGITASLVPSVLQPDFQGPAFLPPQWFVDVADDAKIHVAALIDKTVANDRIFAFAEPWDWNDILASVRKARPNDSRIPKDFPPHGKDLSVVDNEQGAEMLRKWFGQDGWKSLDESVLENLEGIE